MLSVEEVARLLEAAPGIKYRAALGVAYGAGLRVSEVAHLKADGIDSKRMLIRFEEGKARKDRNAMLSPQLLELLRLWWREGKRRSVLLPHGWLFPRRSYTDPVSTRQLHRAVHEAAEAAGIRKRVSPHMLRHSFATHLLEQDVDIRVIQVLLRHSKLETTALYTEVATRTIRAVTGPLDRLMALMEGSRPRVERGVARAHRGRRHLPRRGSCVPDGPCRTPESGPAEGDVGDRDLPYRRHGRSRARLQRHAMSLESGGGGHTEACTDCGHWRVAYNSCRNRHCPRCQGAAARTWLAEREADLLPVG